MISQDYVSLAKINAEISEGQTLRFLELNLAKTKRTADMNLVTISHEHVILDDLALIPDNLGDNIK